MKKMTRTIGKTMILIMAVTIMTTSSKANDSERYINILDEPMPFGVKKFKDESTYEYDEYKDNVLECQNQNSSYVNTIKGQEVQNLLSKQSSNDKVTIDYTNSSEGYIMVQYTSETQNRIKVTIEGENGIRYIYNLVQKEWTIIPISEGSGLYTVTIYENFFGEQFSPIFKEEIDIMLSNEIIPFLTSNVYINFANAPKTIQKANELTRYALNDVEKISEIYNYVINNMTYDEEKAESAKPGYITNLDEILESKKGICLDYAVLIAGMLRSQNIPCKVVVGYAGDIYHAWISVYVEEKMTAICGNRSYDSEHWMRMDPTWASGNLNSANALLYINNPSNYHEKYCY